MKVLGIESSCDETGVALVEAAPAGVPRVLAQALHSQADLHEAFGGVVPELASRDHIRRVLPLTRQVLAEAGATPAEIDLVAYTRGPGLAGALLVGAGVAVALGAALNRDYPAGEAVGFVVGAPLIPFLLMLGGRAIVLRMQNSRAPVLDWPWIIFGTGIIALVLSFANSAQDAEDDGGGDARVPAVTAAL